ncbi:MAG: hypothetical protein HUJ61_01440 [Bacilli bacterium]|nr:hypothetical protein [Bacilli bacterium]
MKQKNKVYSALMLFFCLFASFVGLCFSTYTWFTFNRTAKSTSTEIKTSDDSITVESYRIFKYDLEAKSASSMDENGNYYSLQDLTLNQYDSVFTENNAYAPIIIRFEVTGTLPTNGGVGLHVDRDTTITDANSTEIIAPYISNILEINLLAGNSLYNSTSDNDQYATALSAFNSLRSSNPSSFKTFTSGSVGNYTKVGRINTSAAYTSSDFTGSIMYTFLYLSYSTDLAEAYVDAHEDVIETQIVSGYDLPFSNDLTFLTFFYL